MADQKKRISELPESQSTQGLYTIGVNSQNESVKVPLGSILAGYDQAAQDAAQAKQTATAAQQAAASATQTANSASQAASEAQQAAASAEETAGDADDKATESLSIAKNTSTKRFYGIVSSATILNQSTTAEGLVYYVESSGKFALRVYSGGAYKYYSNWNGADEYMDENRSYPIADKLYIYDGLIYSWNESEEALEVVGNDPAELAAIRQLINTTKAELEAQINVALFINVNKLFNTHNAMTLDGALTLLYDNDETRYWKTQGVVITFLGTSGKMESWQWKESEKIDFTDTSTWEKFGGSASVGNCYNVTNDVPLQSGYYTLERAINVAYSKGYTSIGVQITFAIARNSWKTYQFIGEESAEATFKNINNWLDLAGMSAGAETLINVDALCGACTSAAYYTLEYAIAAIISLSTTTGIDYRKSGLVITYMTDENTWECKQFKGVVSDFGETSLWQDFGGGGSQVETSDEPEEDGEDAFSTGGAYNHLPTGIKVDTETEGVVKLQLENAEHDGIGDEIQFQVAVEAVAVLSSLWLSRLRLSTAMQVARSFSVQPSARLRP